MEMNAVNGDPQGCLGAAEQNGFGCGQALITHLAL
jgi:hypothetical protein